MSDLIASLTPAVNTLELKSCLGDLRGQAEAIALENETRARLMLASLDDLEAALSALLDPKSPQEVD